MSKITLEQWRVLQTVVDAGGFTQAAEVLHKSQSSISYSVTKLQQQLGFSILMMEGRKAKLTQRGQILLTQSRELLGQSERLESLAKSLEASWGEELHVRVEPSVPYALVLDALSLFKANYPGIKVNFSETVLSDNVVPKYTSVTCLELTTIPPVPHQCFPILEFDLVAVVSSGHLLARVSDTLHSDALLLEQQVATYTHDLKNKESTFIATNISTAIDMVCRGLGYAWLPRCEVKALVNTGRLVCLKLSNSPALKQSLYAVIDGLSEKTNSAELFIDTIKEIYTQ